MAKICLISAPGGCNYLTNNDYLKREYFNLKDVQAIDEENTHFLANMIVYAVGEEVFITFSPTPKLWQGAPVYEIGQKMPSFVLSEQFII